MTRRQATASLCATACVALLLSGAVPALIPLLCLLGVLFQACVMERGRWRLPAPMLTAAHTLLIVPFVYLALLHDPPLEFLGLLLAFAAPLLLLRSLVRGSEFNDFFIFLVSLLIVVGSSAVAPGLSPLLITVGFVLVAAQALVALARRPRRPQGGVRLKMLRPSGWWSAAPSLAAHHLGMGGLLLGALLYLVAPRPALDFEARAPGPSRYGDRERPSGGGGSSRAARTGFPSDVRIGDIGRIKRKPFVALQVELRARGRPYDPAPDEQIMLLLRARAWNTYDPATRRWRQPRTSPRPIGRRGILESGAAELDWRFEILGYEGKTLFLPPRPRRIRSLGGPFFVDSLGIVSSREPVFQYSVEAAWPLRRRGELPRVRLDRRERELLEVPPAIAGALRRHLPASPPGDLPAAVAAITGYFSRGFRYTLDLPASLPRERDPLVVFCERQEGHCELYASVACLFLRLKGIPARLAGGLRCAERLDTGRYQARFSNAHAWVEVPARDYGWVALDFTPPDSRAEGPASPFRGGEEEGGAGDVEGEGGLDWSRPFQYGPEEQEEVLGWISDRLSWRAAGTAFGVFFLLLVLRVGIATARKERRNPLRVRAPRGVSRKTLAFYARWLKACAACGHVRRHSQTPREFLAALPRKLRAEGAAITARFEQARYGGARD